MTVIVKKNPSLKRLEHCVSFPGMDSHKKVRQVSQRSSLRPFKLFGKNSVLDKNPTSGGREVVLACGSRENDFHPSKKLQNRGLIINHLLSNKLILVKRSALFKLLEKGKSGDAIKQKWN